MTDLQIMQGYLKAFLITTFLLCLGLIGSCKPAQAASTVIDLEIIAQIESSGDPMAYNKSSQARGLYQITPICLADYNRHPSHRDKESVIFEELLFNSLVNTKVAQWYLLKRIPELLEARELPDTVDNRLIAYNCGVGCIGKKLPKETINYIKKYHKKETLK